MKLFIQFSHKSNNESHSTKEEVKQILTNVLNEKNNKETSHDKHQQ